MQAGGAAADGNIAQRLQYLVAADQHRQRAGAGADTKSGGCAGLSGGDGRLRLAADERGRDEQAGICAALRIFAGGRAGLHGGRREAALYMEGIGEA